MRIDTCILADAAAVHDGKLFIHGGGVTRINAPQLPIGTTLTLVIRLQVELEDFGREHKLSFSISDPDGAFVIPPQDAAFGSEGGHPEDAVPDEELYWTLPIGLGAILFARAGTHRLKVKVDDQERVVPLPVVPLTEEQLRAVASEAAAPQPNRAARRTSAKGQRRR